MCEERTSAVSKAATSAAEVSDKYVSGIASDAAHDATYATINAAYIASNAYVLANATAYATSATNNAAYAASSSGIEIWDKVDPVGLLKMMVEIH